MLLNYLKLSLRLLARNPFFTFINVLGLAVGFSVFIFLWQYSQNELQSDRMWKDWRRIARVGWIVNSSDDGKVYGEATFGMIPAFMIPQLKQDFPEINEFTRYSDFLGAMLFSAFQNQQRVIIKEEKAVYADANFFQFFDIPFVYGTAKGSLANGNSVAISHSTALKFFGERNALGEIIVMNDTLTLKVDGIFADLPANSHLNFDIVISNETRLGRWATLSMYPLVQGYVKTNTIIDWAPLEEKVNSLKEDYWDEIMKRFPRSKLNRMLLQPLPELMFSNAIDNIDPASQKSKPMMVLFGVLGLVVLVIAWINYIIMSLSRATKRMKEVATRKVAGASFLDFAKQFIVEALMLNVISIALGFTLLQVFSGSVNLLFDMPFYGFTTIDGLSIIILLSIFLAGAIITGLYPALAAARFHPWALFHVGASFSKGGKMITWLTTVQYVSAIILILWAFIMYLQLDYVISKSKNDVGESLLVIDAPIIQSSTYQSDFEYFVNTVGAMPGVLDKTMSRNVMGGDDAGSPGLTVYPAGPDRGFVLDSNGGVDENFIPFLNIKMIAGRNFVSSDRGNVLIISEQAAQRLGFATPAEAVGAKVQIEKGETNYGRNLAELEIIGVVMDYQIEPYFMNAAIAEPDPGLGLIYKGYLAEHYFPQRVIIRVEPQNVEAILKKTKKEFEAVFPGNVFNWYWLDEHVTRHYHREETNRNQITLFTSIAIGIACLGLLGMMSHTAVEKTKEIGIRKILGAKLTQIAQLLLNTTVKQIAVATLIGIPTAFYLTQKYLEKYTERIVLEWWHFALPVLILIVILFATIASVLWKAAKSNPVDALKYE